MRLLAGVLHSDEIVWNSYTWDADARKQINTNQKNTNSEFAKVCYGYKDNIQGWYGFSLRKSVYDPSIFVNVRRNILQVRFNNTSGTEEIYEYTLTPK